MFRKTSILAVLIGLVLFMSVATSPTADELPADSFAKYMPADTLMFCEFKDVKASLERADQLAIVRMFTDPEIKDFVNEIVKLMEREAGDEAAVEGKGIVDKGKEYSELMKQAFTGRIAIALTSVNPEKKEFKAIMLAAMTPESKPKFDELLSKAFADMEAKGETPPQVVEMTIEDTAVRAYKEKDDTPDNETVYLALTDEYMAVTAGKASMEDFLRGRKTPINNPLSANPKFLKSYKAVRSQELFWYADYKAYVKMIQPIMDMTAAGNPIANNIFNATSGILDCMAGGLSFDGLKTVDEMVVFLGETKLKYIESMKGKRNSMKTAALMPKNSMVYGSVVLDMSAVYDDLLAMLGPAVEEQIKEYENMLMMSFRDELMPAFGEEIGGYFTFANMTPEFLLAIELKQPEVVEKALGSIEGIMPELPIEKRQFQGSTIRVIQQPGMGMEIGVAIKDNWLMIGLLPSLQGAMTRADANLTNNPDFIEGMKDSAGLPANSVVFIDLKSLMGLGYDYGMMFAQTLLAQYPEFDPATIPSKEAFTGKMMPWMMFGWTAQDGTSGLKVTGPIPYSIYMMANIAVMSAFTLAVPAEAEEEQPEDIF
ncbi:MAG: hypothetical protein Kow00107_00630 [Planctomycetota bacterium]